MVVHPIKRGTEMKNLTALKKALVNISAASLLAITATMALAQSHAYAAVALEAKIESGLPVPAQNSMQGTEKTPLQITSQATVAASVEDVAAFYRAELAKLNWQEDKSKEIMNAQGAVLQFTSPEGPATLTLVCTGSDTQIKLSLRKVEAAKKSGLLAPEGQTRVMFGSFIDNDAVVTIGGQSIKLSAHQGETSLDGPTVDLKPGTYTYEVEALDQEPLTAELVVGANEIWGVMVAPEGMLPMQMY
jgi:hypothetical protein